MDITLARTFLEIVDCGNFVRAAERLHVTQTAVSVRVQSLEAQLGRKLFIRNKAGATLTPVAPATMASVAATVRASRRRRAVELLMRNVLPDRSNRAQSCRSVGREPGG